MELVIDTSDATYLNLALRGGEKEAELSIPSAQAQAEKLLPAVERLLARAGTTVAGIKAIAVETRGGGFTSLRIGVATANALAYALGIPVRPVQGVPRGRSGITVAEPKYAKPPSVTLKRAKRS